MKSIILVRHAKSSWSFQLSDFERPLEAIGITKAIKTALKTKEFIAKKSVIWSSTAKRASDTSKIFVTNWNLDTNNIVFKDNLYTFNASELEQIVKSCPDNVNNLILFGHNNAITDFVNKFGDIFIDNVPTAGFVSIIFDETSWSSIKNGKTNKIIFPRDS